MAKSRHSLIERRSGPGGESAYISGTRVRVSDIAGLYAVLGEALRIQEALPHLSQPQILAAIDYWHSHQTKVEAEVNEEELLLERLSSTPP